MFKKNYNDTGENQLSAEHIRVLVSITLCHIMEQLRLKTGNPLAILVLYILLILCHPNVSNKLYHGTGEDQLSSQQKIRTGEYCLEERCVSSWIRYGLKRGIPWYFLFYLYFINITSSVVVLYHRILQNTKTFKMPTKVDNDATNTSMGINYNEQEPGGTNKYVNVTDELEPKEFSQTPM